MAITLNAILDQQSLIKRLDVPGDAFLGVVELAGDTSYPANGYAIGAASLYGLTSLKFIMPIACTDGHTFSWDEANKKVKLFVRTTGVEVAGAVNVSTARIYVLVAGN